MTIGTVRIAAFGTLCVFGAFMGLHRQGLLRGSLITGANSLFVAQADYLKHGYITNYPSSHLRVWLSSNVVNIAGTQYQYFAVASGGWGWNEGTLGMTTNRTLIWSDAHTAPKILTPHHRPPFWGGPY